LRRSRITSKQVDLPLTKAFHFKTKDHCGTKGKSSIVPNPTTAAKTRSGAALVAAAASSAASSLKKFVQNPSLAACMADGVT
jgi:hypothetical protein